MNGWKKGRGLLLKPKKKQLFDSFQIAVFLNYYRSNLIKILRTSSCTEAVSRLGVRSVSSIINY
jgi:hypothetical protein